MTDSKALIERLREWPMREQVQTYDHTFHIAETGSSYTTKRVIPQSPKPVMHEAADHIEKLEADNARLNDALRQAVIDATEWARKAGEAQGKLEISEAAGVLDGWIRDCKRLEADNARLREALGAYTEYCNICHGRGSIIEEDEATGADLWRDCPGCTPARAALQGDKP